MDIAYLDVAFREMSDRGIAEIAPGLTDHEIAAAEERYGFRFPPDLRLLLSHGLPLGQRFPDWRDLDSSFFRDILTWPADGLCFDIEHDDFWINQWGQKPGDLQRAKEVARAAVRAAPFLIPIYAHRYLPAIPDAAGNPVFSIYQSDIIYYGFDLPSYLNAEFQIGNPYEPPRKPREIELWSLLERLNG